MRTKRVRNKIAPQEILTGAVIQNRNKHYHEQTAQENQLTQELAEWLTGTKFEDFFQEVTDAVNSPSPKSSLRKEGMLRVSSSHKPSRPR